MRDGVRDLLVIPGGFYELNLYSNDESIMYTGKWSYWILQAVRNGYDLSFQWVMGENKTYLQHTIFNEVRTWCAKMSIPFSLPYGKYGTLLPRNDHTSYSVAFRMEVPHIHDAKIDSIRHIIDMFYQRVSALVSQHPKENIRLISAL